MRLRTFYSKQKGDQTDLTIRLKPQEHFQCATADYNLNYDCGQAPGNLSCSLSPPQAGEVGKFLLLILKYVQHVLWGQGFVSTLCVLTSLFIYLPERQNLFHRTIQTLLYLLSIICFPFKIL